MKNILIILLIHSTQLLSQVISEPIESDVYNFLFSLQNKTTLNPSVRIPLTRNEIGAEMRKYGGSENNKLTGLQREKADYYLRDYSNEPDSESSFLRDKNGFYHLYSYRDENFSFVLDPVFSIAYLKGNIGGMYYRNGLYVRGDFLNNFGYSLLFYDQHTDLPRNYKYNWFSRKPGIHVAVREGDYSELRGGIWYDFGAGRISAAKDFMKIGSGMDGQLIMSDKAPSFPFINLELDPVEWLNFNYYLGFLNSGLADSSTIRHINTTTSYNKTFDRRDKYLALHYLTFYPFSTLSFTLGESVVFSDRLEFLYLVPVMFFRLADHFYSHRDTGDNAQIFADVSYRILPVQTKLYFTLYIDELQLTKALKGDDDANRHIAYTLGTYITDPLIKNSGINIEYTRINPFVYNNFNPAQTYFSSGYQLGHWIGSNADQIHIKYRQDFSLSGKWLGGTGAGRSGGFGFIEIWYDYIRKGKRETVDEQYTFPNPGFLYGGISYYSDAGVSFNWEPVNSLRIKLEYVRHLKTTAALYLNIISMNKSGWSFR
jgi:hypothetical protein